MNTPGFTAEASLGRVTHTFRALRRQPRSANSVEAAALCRDQACFDNCEWDCSYCDDVPHNLQRQCARPCVAHNMACLRRCCLPL